LKAIQQRLLTVIDQNELKHFEDKKYRDGYLQSRVRGYIAYQIQALREKLDLTQEAFATLTGKKQSAISRLEDTEYGRVSVQTLLDIACAAGVALVVKFVSYPEFLDQTRQMSTTSLQPDTIYQSLEKVKEKDIRSGTAAQAHFREAQIGQRSANSASAVANDNAGRGSLGKVENKSALGEVYKRPTTLPSMNQAGAA
jgi:transcriptional regulator with XRE-family HTH domain